MVAATCIRRRSSGSASSHSARCSARSRSSAPASISPSIDGRLAHRDRAGTERLDGEAVLGELGGALGQPRHVVVVEFDDLRDQQDLPRDAGLVERRSSCARRPAARARRADRRSPGRRGSAPRCRCRAPGRARRRAAGRAHRRAGSATSTRAVAAAPPTSNASCAASAKPAGSVLAQAATAVRAGVPGRANERRQSKLPRRRQCGRAERRDGGAAAGRRGAAALARQPFLQRVHQQRAHQAGIAEPHLGLGRMHVHVHLARRQRDEQRDDRMAVARQIVGVGAAHHAEQQLVAHRPAVDEQILPERVGARERRQRDDAFDRDVLALAFDLDGVGAKLSVRECRRAAPAVPARRAAPPAMSPARAPRRSSVKATSGRLIARRRTTSRTASASVRSCLRNFSRAGVA